jgi:hypothetical protein
VNFHVYLALDDELRGGWLGSDRVQFAVIPAHRMRETGICSAGYQGREVAALLDEQLVRNNQLPLEKRQLIYSRDSS